LEQVDKISICISEIECSFALPSRLINEAPLSLSVDEHLDGRVCLDKYYFKLVTDLKMTA